MDRVRVSGLALMGLSLAGYAVGVVAPYPGREASLAGVMVGLTLVAIGD